MKSVITIEDTKDGVAVTVHSEERPGKYITSIHMFDLILKAVEGRFKPLKTHFIPVRKERIKR